MLRVVVDYLPLGHDRPGTPLHPQGVVVHSTATPGASARQESQAFHTHDWKASAHYFVDWDQAIKLIPTSEVAWHAGPTANSRYLGVELCETTDPTLFARVIDNGVELVADLCRAFGWEPKLNETVWSHAAISETFRETDHIDPIPYFSSFGWTFSRFFGRVYARWDEMRRLATAKEA